MRVTEILTEESDPRIKAMQKAMRKAGATNPDGTPLTIDGALGPNTQAVMSNPQFAKYVPRDVSLGTNSGPHRIAKQPAAAAAPAQPEAVPVAAAPAEPATAPPDSNVGATSTLASPLPSLAAAPAEPAPAVARPAMPHTATPADAYAPEVPTSIDPIVRKRQGLPPATTAEIDAYEKANPPVVSGAVDRNGQPIISGGQKKVIDAAREAAPKELSAQQQAQNMLQPGYNTTTGQNKNIGNDSRDAAKAQVLDNGQTVVIGNQARKKGDLNWRNNNPGNISGGKVANSLGAIGQNGRWAIFPDIPAGFKAMHDLLTGPAYNKLTAKQAIDKWAPPFENNTAGYIAQLAKAGLDMDKKYTEFTPAQQQLYQQTVNRIEGGHAGQVVAASAPAQPVAEEAVSDSWAIRMAENVLNRI